MERVHMNLSGHRGIVGVGGGGGTAVPWGRDSDSLGSGMQDGGGPTGAVMYCRAEVTDVRAHFLPRQLVLLHHVVHYNLLATLLEPLTPDQPAPTADHPAGPDRSPAGPAALRSLSFGGGGGGDDSASLDPPPPLDPNKADETEAAAGRGGGGIDAALTVSRIEVELEEEEEDVGASGERQRRPHSSLSLLRPRLSFRLARPGGEAVAVLSVQRLGIRRAGPAGVPAQLLRFYEPCTSSSPAAPAGGGGTACGGDGGGGVGGTGGGPGSETLTAAAAAEPEEVPAAVTEPERMPQLHLECRRPCSPSHPLEVAHSVGLAVLSVSLLPCLPFSVSSVSLRLCVCLFMSLFLSVPLSVSLPPSLSACLSLFVPPSLCVECQN